MSSFQQRLADLMRIGGISTVAELARRLGYDRSERVRKVANGVNQPSYEMVTDLIHAFPHINPRWLIVGEGDPLSLVEYAKGIELDKAIQRITDGRGIPTLKATQKDHPIDHPTPKEGGGSVRSVLSSVQEPPGVWYKPAMVTVDQQGEPNIVMLDAQAAAGLPANYSNPEFFEGKPAFRMPGSGRHTGVRGTRGAQRRPQQQGRGHPGPPFQGGEGCNGASS